MIELIKRLLIRFLEWLVSYRPDPRGSKYSPADLVGSQNENNDRFKQHEDKTTED